MIVEYMKKTDTYKESEKNLKKKAHRLIENRKCHNAFELIRLT